MIPGDMYETTGECPSPRRYRIIAVDKKVITYYSVADQMVRRSSRIQWELDVEWQRLRKI